MGENNKNNEQATFGAGCFWCVEAIFEKLNGVVDVKSGYAGGKIANPTYEEVCKGTTGHAEVIQINFDPKIITYKELLDILWKAHDPTTLNKQGADIGSQYRSVIFYHNESQEKIAKASIKQLNKLKIYNAPIITEVLPLNNFYFAEEYHQNYYQFNKNAPYCKLVIAPKINKIFNSNK